MPDLDQIKQGEQECGTGQAFPKRRSDNRAGLPWPAD
jgi:hypothetical protein